MEKLIKLIMEKLFKSKIITPVKSSFYFGLYFEDNRWFISISELKETIVTTMAIRRHVIELQKHCDFFTTTDEDHLLYIKPYDTIYYNMLEAISLISNYFIYSGKLSNVCKDDNIINLVKHLEANSKDISDNIYPNVKTIYQEDIDTILDNILKNGINSLTVKELKILELNGK